MSGTVDFRKSASKRGYDTQWKKLRQWHIENEPLCRHCRERGITRAAEEVDHIESVNSRPDLRLEPSNLQSLCRSCHVRKTRNNDEPIRKSVIRIVSSPSINAASHYVYTRMVKGELVFNIDAIGKAIGFAAFPRPQDVIRLLMIWRDSFVQQLCGQQFRRDVWVTCADLQQARELASKTDGHVINLHADADGRGGGGSDSSGV